MKRFSICLAILIMLMSCHEDSDEVITIIENPVPPSVLITTRLVSIIDPSIIEAYHPQQIFAGHTASFELIPYTQIKESGINRDYELISLTTDASLSFFKVQSLVENDVNYTHLSIPAVDSYTGQSSANATFTLTSEASLHIPSNSLTYADGSTYQGSYQVGMSSMLPGKESALNIPSFTGITRSNEEVSLLIDECYYIVVRASDGSELKSTGAAYISLLSSSPNQHWNFNAESGRWTTIDSTNETDLTKISIRGSGYYATAKSKTITRVKGTLTMNGSPLPNFPISISYEGQKREIYTTNKGAWAIQLPSATACSAKIILPCGGEEEIAWTTSQEKEMQIPIALTSDEIENVLILGNARDCSLNPISNHMTLLEGETNTVIFSPDPEINIYFPICKNGSIGIASLNMMDGESGPSIIWDAADTIQIYTSFACQKAHNEYLSLIVSGEKKMYWNPKSDFLSDNRLLISDDGSEQDHAFQVFVEGMTKGVYQDNMLNILFEDMHLGNKGYSLHCPTATSGCGFTTFTITHFPQQTGEWIRGHFEGTFWIKTFQPLTAGYRPVVGEFQVYRDF